MAVRGRAAAAAAMAAVERRPPSLEDFAGQSWSAWVARAGPAADTAGAELEESSKNGSKKLDAMTLIKEDMSIFGHCPAHDEFYLVVCNHCSQVVKPQAFQKHCERRHGPLSKLYSRAQASSNAQKCHVVNGQPPACGGHGTTKVTREKAQSSRSRAQHPSERPEKAQKDNLCLFMPVVNLEKISSLPKPDGHGIKVPPKPSASSMPGQPSTSSKEPLGKPSLAASPKDPLVPSKVGGDSIVPTDAPSRKPESTSALGEKELSSSKPPPKSHKKMARKECDLNRQCGVVNPETKKICTRLLTCKIHSVHQRREVQGRAKDFDVLVAELKANSRKGESPKDKSPVRKEAAPERLSQDSSSLAQTALVLPSTSPCRAKQPHSHCAPLRSRVSSESDLEDLPTVSSEGDPGLYPFPLPKGNSRLSSDESEDDTAEDVHGLDCHYATRPPRPQAFCTFGSRLVSPGCYVFNRRLDRFCSALSSMLERHLNSHMWKKIPPAADPQLHTASSPTVPGASAGGTAQTYSSSPACSLPHSTPGRTSSSCTASASVMAARESRSHPSLNYTVGSPHAAAACSQSDCTGGSQSITSPLPANTPSPSFSKLPSTKASKSSKAKELAGSVEPEASARKRKQPLGAAASPPYKRTCLLDSSKGKAAGCQVSHPPAKTKPSLGSSSTASFNGALSPGSRVKRAGHLDCRATSHPPVKASQLENRGSPLNGPKALQANCISDEEAKKRKNTATYCRPMKPKHSASSSSSSSSSSDSGCSIRRKKPVASLAFEEKRNALKSKAH
ncbi:ataxin-7-like protein 2 isoform X3 [Alligator mississippiensis]|uniref:ataxin-7-like protein 2 isoform X3 n=1 Tax=Alligator mississippiensis TaxID=8496 RepID=UPI002877AA37|nr:ataxin-7-like protein 2 isoform X3 [Alligator mississippiensis]